MEEKILNFIKKRFSIDNNWLTGNCYWFALILCYEFGLQLYYEPIDGHFLAGRDKEYFDWSGKVKDKKDYILFKDLIEKDPVWAYHIIRDCKD